MKRIGHIAALGCALFVPIIHADQASANYSNTLSIDGGGQRVTSADYEHNVIVTPISGRVVATFSDVMVIGFASRLNTAPVAVDDVRSHPFDAPVVITISSLFANDFDPDGDTLSLVTVDPQSAAGGTLSVNGQTIAYTPPKGLDAADHFQYTVADSNGDIASATVTLAIAPPISSQPLNTVSLSEQSDGKFLLRFRQNTGFHEYIIQFSNDLNDPNWQTLQDTHAGADGFVELLIDPSLAKDTFFRAVVF